MNPPNGPEPIYFSTMKALSNLLYRATNLYICIALTAITVLYASLVMGSQSECISEGLAENVSILALTFGYTYDAVIQLFSSLSETGLQCYSQLLKVYDTIFPIIYGSMYLFWVSLIYKNQKWKFKGLRILNLYPLLPIFADFVENYFENRLIVQFLGENDVLESTVQFASLATQIKWTLSTFNYLIILGGIVVLVVSNLKRKAHEKAHK